MERILGYNPVQIVKMRAPYLVHNSCWRNSADSAKVNPPGGETAEVEDVFTFTLSVEPTEVGLAGRENIKLTVNGEPEEFALNSLITPNVLAAIGGLVLAGFAYLLLRRRV